MSGSTRRRAIITSLATAFVTLAAAVGAMLAGSAPAYAAGTSQQVWLTFYGWYDNTPPGCDTAFGGCAGGTGTHADPITFATDKAEAPQGTVIWVPRVGKYFVMDDDCTERPGLVGPGPGRRAEDVALRPVERRPGRQRVRRDRLRGRADLERRGG